MRPAEEIATSATAELEAIIQLGDRSIQDAASYRDHLLILFLIYWPICMRNLVGIRLGQLSIGGSNSGHLNPQTTETRYIDASQTKAGRRHRAAVQALRKKLQ